jgi:DNA-binding response OmpR family regulator
MHVSTNSDICVLVIEDELDIAEMYQVRLVADGYSVLVANCGEEGIRLANEALPDFIYLDLGLGGLDGLQVLDHLRSSPKTATIPVIILTNNDDPELRRRGLTLGSIEFMIKADTTPAQLSMTVSRTTSVPAALRMSASVSA